MLRRVRANPSEGRNGTWGAPRRNRRVPSVVTACMALGAGLLLFAQEPTRPHPCRPSDESEARRVVEEGQVPDLRLVERAPVELPEGCEAGRGETVRYEYEVLVDERGEVACAVLLNEVEGVSPCVMKSVTKSVGYSRFTEPKDSRGEEVSCYARVVVESDLR